MATQADLDRLAKLRAAYDALLTGEREISISDADGRSVSYQQGQVAALRQEIRELEFRTGQRRRGALRFAL